MYSTRFSGINNNRCNIFNWREEVWQHCVRNHPTGPNRRDFREICGQPSNQTEEEHVEGPQHGGGPEEAEGEEEAGS